MSWDNLFRPLNADGDTAARCLYPSVQNVLMVCEQI
jgi:hypothetical protein